MGWARTYLGLCGILAMRRLGNVPWIVSTSCLEHSGGQVLDGTLQVCKLLLLYEGRILPSFILVYIKLFAFFFVVSYSFFVRATVGWHGSGPSQTYGCKTHNYVPQAIPKACS